MLEQLASLPGSARVLDLGCDEGSFHAESLAARVVRVDLERRRFALGNGHFAQADARDLPFPDGCFAAVIANNSLEHVEGLERALAEIGRVLQHPGLLYVAVPDSSTFTDRLYRWLASGGGHVNPFTDPAELARRISEAVGLPLAGTRLLHSGLSFLNLRNSVSPPLRAWLVGRGYEPVLLIGTYLLRRLDQLLGARLSVYGWAFYFGPVAEFDPTARTNVCIRCGGGHGAEWLASTGQLRRLLGFRYYRCPNCTAINLFTNDGLSLE